LANINQLSPMAIQTMALNQQMSPSYNTFENSMAL